MIEVGSFLLFRISPAGIDLFTNTSFTNVWDNSCSKTYHLCAVNPTSCPAVDGDDELMLLHTLESLPRPYTKPIVR